MITAKDVRDFDREVRKWQSLTTEEQDNVISKALELYVVKGVAYGIGRPFCWLLKVAKWNRREELRRRKQDRKRFAELCEPLTADRWRNGKPVERVIVADSISRLPTNLSASSYSMACQKALESLTLKERQVIELCDIQGFMPAEAGRKLSMGRSTTKSHLVRARKKMRDSALNTIAGQQKLALAQQQRHISADHNK